MNGIIIINKAKGITSQNVVSKVKRICHAEKAGHIGTLDPLATGVLPILLGNYTKLSKYLIEHNKTYIATCTLGKKTDTADAEGITIEEKEIPKDCFHEKYIQTVLDTFKGKQWQTPPMYSAIKVNGKKLYEYAREGQKVEIPKREINILDIKLKSWDASKKEITFEVTCSKGTYIRTLCEDFAEKMQTVGYMRSLERIKVDQFSIEDAITIEKLEKHVLDRAFMEKNIIKMETLFENFPSIRLDAKKEKLFLNGVMLTFEKDEGIYNIYNTQQEYLGLGIIQNHLLKRDVIIEEK